MQTVKVRIEHFCVQSNLANYKKTWETLLSAENRASGCRKNIRFKLNTFKMHCIGYHQVLGRADRLALRFGIGVAQCDWGSGNQNWPKKRYVITERLHIVHSNTP